MEQVVKMDKHENDTQAITENELNVDTTAKIEPDEISTSETGVEAEIETETEAKTDTEAEVETEAEAEVEVEDEVEDANEKDEDEDEDEVAEVEVEAEKVAKTDVEAETKTKAIAKAELTAEIRAEIQAEIRAELYEKARLEAQTKIDSSAKRNAEIQAKVKTQAKEKVDKAKAKIQAEAQSKIENELNSENQTITEKIIEAEIKAEKKRITATHEVQKARAESMAKKAKKDRITGKLDALKKVEEDIEQHADFMESIKEACNLGWSGILSAYDGNNQVGAIIMRSGEIGWANYNKQKETLGTFLLQQGEISKEQLNQLQNLYSSLHKTKKLGVLLEESNIISRTRLKHFLKMHIRKALTLMFTKSSLRCVSKGGTMQVDEELTFSWKELFYRDIDARDPIPRILNSTMAINITSSNKAAHGNHILRIFGSLSGYKYSFIARTDGHLVTIHKKPHVDDTILSLKWLGEMLSSLNDASLGAISEVSIKCDDGILLTQFITESMNYILCVAVDNSGKTGVVQHRIAKEIKNIEHYINTQR
jgi:hypothetical protein